MPSRDERSSVNPLFARPGGPADYPKYKLDDGGLDPELAYQLVHDEVMLDGNARLNLATFVTTWMDDWADKLYGEAYDKNMIDKDEYPATAMIEDRCVRIIAGLWNAPEPMTTIGVSTIGSSEAAMMGGLALKRRWQNARRAAGKPIDRPNLVMSSAVQVCWEKFANYWDVEPRFVPVSPDHFVMDGHELEKYVDENTIGVVVILGVTYTGRFDDVAKVARALDVIQQKTGLDVPIHVDAASGGFVAPFLDGDLAWDFRLPRVHSINASGHKYGLVYPGLGWVVWRSADVVPEDLVFNVAYLGGSVPTLALNFSRPGAQVLLQYYAFLRLGREGYRAVQQHSRDVAEHVVHGLEKLGGFKIWSDGSQLPVVAFGLGDDAPANWDLYDLSARLREKGWLVPAYPLPADMQDVAIMRVNVRNGLSHDLADLLLADLTSSLEYLKALDGPLPKKARRDTSFHH
jgi:glutamate decarboxylase